MKSVVLLSGGQDSTTCLFDELAQRPETVLCLSIWYGQKHDIELQAAREVVSLAQKHYPDVEILHEELRIGSILNSTSPLVSGEALGKYENVDALPGGVEPTFVPGRNILFLTIAGNRAAEIGANRVVTGVCQEDFGGYFDCRQQFINAMAVALNQGIWGEWKGLEIITPLMNLTKAESVQLAEATPHAMEALAYSHTCYGGTFPPCGKCHACHLRAKGFHEAGIEDPLMERVTQWEEKPSINVET